jgi:hypothetical protein
MPSFKVTDTHGVAAGEFFSIDDAKRSLPQVWEWRADESRPMGWNGWMEHPAPDSPPDYKITFTDETSGLTNSGGFFRVDPENAIARERPDDLT